MVRSLAVYKPPPSASLRPSLVFSTLLAAACPTDRSFDAPAHAATRAPRTLQALDRRSAQPLSLFVYHLTTAMNTSAQPPFKYARDTYSVRVENIAPCVGRHEIIELFSNLIGEL